MWVGVTWWGEGVLRARKRSSERIAMLLTRRMETAALYRQRGGLGCGAVGVGGGCLPWKRPPKEKGMRVAMVDVFRGCGYGYVCEQE